jgi:hypothetical protein
MCFKVLSLSSNCRSEVVYHKTEQVRGEIEAECGLKREFSGKEKQNSLGKQ